MLFFWQGVVTAGTSLIHDLVLDNPDDYKGCVPLAVSRLSRVRKTKNSEEESVICSIPASSKMQIGIKLLISVSVSGASMQMDSGDVALSSIIICIIWHDRH